MRKNCTLIFFCLMMSCLPESYAQQKNYAPGWFVTLRNDTLKGFIATGKKDNFSSFDFKTTMTAPGSKVWMNNVKSLTVDDQLYISWFGQRCMEYIDKVDLSLIRNDGVYRADSIVLKRLYAGHDFSLFYYKDEKDHFFIETCDYIDELLVTYDYLSYWDKLRIRGFQFPAYYVNNIYRSQITARFSERLDHKTNALLSRTQLDKYSLLRLFRTLDEL